MTHLKNKDESRAKKYLQTLGYKDLTHEPLGNVTPDFLIDNKIAVEVRRLNRNHIDNENRISIENLEIVLVKKIKKFLKTFHSKNHTHSVNISIHFEETFLIKNLHKIIKKIKRKLSKHAKHPEKHRIYFITESIQIICTPKDPQKEIYQFSDCNNDEFWISNKLLSKIQENIIEKNEKISENFKIYPEWWLVLVDSIIYSLDEEDFLRLQTLHPKKYKFSKIIILSAKGKFETFSY